MVRSFLAPAGPGGRSHGQLQARGRDGWSGSRRVSGSRAQVPGAALGVGYGPLVTHSLARVPLAGAADASGLLTTTLQLGQVIGVAVFGSLFLSLAMRAGQPGLPSSSHAIAVTSGWLALLFAAAALAAIPLAGTVARARRSAGSA